MKDDVEKPQPMLRYFEPEGSTVEQMRDHARQHPLAKEGDMKLVWINEGDLSIYLLAAMQSAHVADSPPAAIREAALQEAYEVVYKWWFGDGNALPQELILALIGETK